MKYKLIIFDFDDTLTHLGIDWNKVKDRIIKNVEAIGVELPDKIKNMDVMHIGNYLSENGHKKIVFNAFRDAERNCIANKEFAVFPKAMELLRKLKAEGYLIAIASGNTTSTIRKIIHLQNISPDFIAGLDSTVLNKPYPDILNLVLKYFNLKNNEVLFVGNSKFDSEAGKNAKIKTIIIKPDNGKDLSMLYSLLIKKK